MRQETAEDETRVRPRHTTVFLLPRYFFFCPKGSAGDGQGLGSPRRALRSQGPAPGRVRHRRGARTLILRGTFRKEVIQPQVPLRLPCYDFTPVANPTVDGYPLLRGWRTGLRSNQLPWCDGRCVQGPGTYSPWHADPRLLAIPPSRGELQPAIRTEAAFGD